MSKIDDERIVNTDTVKHAPIIQKGNEGDAARDEVASCPASDGPQTTALAMQAVNTEVRAGIDDPADFSQWEVCLEEYLEQRYADDFDDIDECGYCELHGRYNMNEYGPASELFTPNWPADASSLFGLLLRLAEESFYELHDFNNRRIDDIRPKPWDETKYRIWHALQGLGLTPFIADRLISDTIHLAHSSYWGFYDRSGKSQLADNFYEAEGHRYMRDKKILNMSQINKVVLPRYAGYGEDVVCR